ncbi:MAG: TonB-dependent receptor [Acidobacteriia bacterium]|nr:TonB-dependent receptor [Terriglobia bacterium]
MRSAKLAIALLFLTFTYAAFGQTGGTITGLISDPAGAVVANAPVEAKNTATGVVVSAATSATGNYVFGALPAGTYDISATVPGFKKYSRTGITVQQLQTTRIDIALEIGASTESVTVSADASLLKTETGDVSHNVTTERVDELPMGQIGAVRVTTQVIMTIPGVNGGLTNMSINGSPAASERVRIDGMDATYTLGNAYYSFGAPSVDSISEVAVQTSNYAAEYGQSTGAVLSFTMRSGTNQYHGSAYDYWTNEAFNANGAYSHTRNKSRINDYGGTAGGPIWIPKVYKGKDRTFFFFTYESRPTTTANSTRLVTVPTPDYRIGNFSAATAATANKVLSTDVLGRPIIQNSIYDPSSQRSVGGNLVRDAFPNNTIPTAQLDKVALKVQALVPQPQGQFSTQLINNFINPFQTKSQYYVPSIKIDHSLSSKIKLSGNWGWNHQGTAGPPTNLTAEGLPSLISVLAPTDWNTINYRLNYDQTLTPTLLLHLGGAYVDSRLDMPTPYCCFNNAKELGLTGPFVDHAFPAFNGGATGMLGPNNTGGMNIIGPAPGIGAGFNGTQNTNEAKTNLVANLTWVKNNHTFKFGAEASMEGYPNYNIISTNGLFTFSGNETALPYLNSATVSGNTIGLPYASFLLGLPDSYEVDSPAVARLGKHQLGIYGQDSWKVNRKLTLELGLRYDYSTAGKEQYGRYNNFDPKVANTQDGGHPGGVTYGATCGCDNNFFNSYKLGFGPRLGVAYQLTPKTVLRGGIGLLIGTTADNGIQTRSVTSVNRVPSAAFAQSPLPNGLAGGVPLTFAQIAWPNFNPSNFPVVTAPGTPGTAPGVWIDKNAGYPSKSYQYSFSVQREIVRDLVVDVSYVGNRGVWLPSTGAVNYNANTPQSLLAAGLDITSLADRNILNAPIGSTAAGRFQNKLPYAGFPLTATVAQSLRPFPQFTNAPTPLWAPLGDNWYNSMQLKVIKRLSHGLDVSYNFTWSKSLSNGIEANQNDIFNRGTNKYLSGLDRPLVSNININYTVPAASWAGNKILKYVLADWTTGALLTYASGTPILVPASTNSLNTSYFLPTASYLNRKPGVPLFLQDLNCHCFDPTKTLVLNSAAWENSAPGTYSSSPAYYNDYRTQRHPTENFNVGRTFRIRESMSFSVRGEFVNIFNRIQLPTTTLSSGTPLTAPTCFVSGNSGPTGACSTGATFASGYGFIQTAAAVGGVRTGQIVARFRF